MFNLDEYTQFKNDEWLKLKNEMDKLPALAKQIDLLIDSYNGIVATANKHAVNCSLKVYVSTYRKE